MEETEMKKVLAIIILTVLCFSCCLAEQEEEIKPYNVFIGIQWGDSIETVKEMFGKGKESHIDIMTFIRYDNVKLGELEPNNIRFSFVEERLFGISATFILPKEDFYQNMINAFTQELGAETTKEEYKYIWELPDGTRIEVETDKHNNSVDLSFTNSEWVEEENTEK